MMKNLLFVFVAAIVVFISSCGKTTLGLTSSSSASTTITNPADIVGTWYYTTDTINYYTASKLDSSKYFSYVKSDYLQFNSDGTGVAMRDNASENFTYSIVTTTLTMQFSAGAKQLAINPQQINTDGIRTLSTSGTIVEGDIKTLTTTALVLAFNTVTGANTTSTETAHFSQ